MRNVIVFVGRRNVYKLLWGKVVQQKNREHLAAKQNKNKTSIWKDRGVFYTPVLTVGDSVLLNKARRLPKKANKTQIDNTIQEFLRKVPINAEQLPWYDTLDQYQFNQFINNLPKKQSDYVLAILEDVYLPRTAAHGDLIDRHFYQTEQGEVKIIDWEFFRERGSVVTDILRCYVFRFANSYRHDPYNPLLLKKRGLPISFPDNIFDEDKTIPDLDQLSVLGAITNTCIPVPDLLFRKRIKRFSTHLNQYAKNKHLRGHPHPQPPRWPRCSG